MVKAVVGANWGDEGKGKITDMHQLLLLPSLFLLRIVLVNIYQRYLSLTAVRIILYFFLSVKYYFLFFVLVL